MDGAALLQQVEPAHDLPWLHDLPARQILRAVWQQHDAYQPEPGAGQESRVRWRTTAPLPAPGERLESPDDPEARLATKRVTQWRGYKVPGTATGDPDRPHLITDGQTTPAPVPDVTRTQAIEQALCARELPPAQHCVDAGYTEADWIVTSQRQRGVAVVGWSVRCAPTRGGKRARHPARRSPSSASSGSGARGSGARGSGARGSGARRSARKASAACPGRPPRTALRWQPRHPVISVTCSRPVSRSCPVRAQGTRSIRQARQLSVRVQADYEAVARVRAEQETAEWKTSSRQRAGGEGTLAQGVRRMGLRHARYLGVAKVQLQHLATAVALNLVRLDNWLAGVPWATTRSSRFARLGLAS